MIGKLYIDNIDVYSTYGVFITKDSYKSLLSYPSLKTLASTNWPDEDGVDVDLSASALDMRELTLQFGAHRQIFTGDFITLLSDKGHHEFRFTELNKTYKLRLVSMPNIEVVIGLELFSLQLADDFPLQDYQYTPPIAVQGVWEKGEQLDSIDFGSIDLDSGELVCRSFSDYGIRMLEGADAEIGKSSDVKKNISINLSSRPGIIYDDSEVYYQPKDVKLKCLMQAPSIDVFWHNYNALLYDLAKPQEKKLQSNKRGESYSCYYRSSSIEHFMFDKSVACWFDITLTFTSHRATMDLVLLASEEENIILTEDHCTIDFKHYGN